jgi:hypothetical protein
MTYTVLINSNDANSGTIDNSRYFFDWQVFDESHYKVYVQFVSSSLTSDFGKVPNLFIELGQSNSFRTNPNLIIGEHTQFVGQLYKVETKTSPYLISDANSKCIDLIRIPTNKDFTVRIQNDDGTPFSSETEFSYTIKLTFEKY